MFHGMTTSNNLPYLKVLTTIIHRRLWNFLIHLVSPSKPYGKEPHQVSGEELLSAVPHKSNLPLSSHQPPGTWKRGNNDRQRLKRQFTGWRKFHIRVRGHFQIWTQHRRNLHIRCQVQTAFSRVFLKDNSDSILQLLCFGYSQPLVFCMQLDKYSLYNERNTTWHIWVSRPWKRVEIISTEFWGSQSTWTIAWEGFLCNITQFMPQTYVTLHWLQLPCISTYYFTLYSWQTGCSLVSFTLQWHGNIMVHQLNCPKFNVSTYYSLPQKVIR